MVIQGLFPMLSGIDSVEKGDVQISRGSYGDRIFISRFLSCRRSNGSDLAQCFCLRRIVEEEWLRNIFKCGLLHCITGGELEGFCAKILAFFLKRNGDLP